MPKHFLSKEAINDLDAIWDYSASKWSVTQANKYTSNLYASFEFISQNPSSGKKLATSSDILQVLIASHLVFYRLQTDRIEIVRVLHKKSDFLVKLTRN